MNDLDRRLRNRVLDMPTLNKQIHSMINAIVVVLVRVIGVHRKDDELAAERAAYAEIGRIVGVPFSVANV